MSNIRLNVQNHGDICRLGTQAGQAQMRSEARQEWAAIVLLLAQLLTAHTGAIPDDAARAAAKAALAALVQATQHYTRSARAATSTVDTGYASHLMTAKRL